MRSCQGDAGAGDPDPENRRACRGPAARPVGRANERGDPRARATQPRFSRTTQQDRTPAEIHAIAGYFTTGPGGLLLGTVGAVASGLAGGLVAAWLAASQPLRHAAALAIPIGLDTASIVAKAGPGSDPLWFDLGGSMTLLLSALVGGYLMTTRGRSRGSRTAPSV